MQRVAVVGAGLAGARVCEELRGQGYDGSIVLVGAETHLPYDRPPLSKNLLFGLTDDTTLPVAWEDLGRRPAARRGRDPPGSWPAVDVGGTIEYDSAILALGARPIRLPADRGSTVLRTVDDARALRAALLPGARMTVIDAGWLGGGGAGPALVRPGRHRLAVRHRGRSGRQPRITMTGGERLDGDVVLTAIGVRPELGWQSGSGLEVADGIVTDAAGRTSRRPPGWTRQGH